VEAENFDRGGEGVAYHTGTVNQGGQYRPSQDVSIEGCTDTGGGYDVGWTAAGQWMGYTVNVTSSGSYDITARVSSGAGGGMFHLEFGPVGQIGASTVATLNVPATGGWQTWVDVKVPAVPLAAGTQWMRIVEDTSGYNINRISFASSGSGGGGGGTGSSTGAGGRCGALGAEAVLALALARLLGRRAGGSFPGRPG
jgi:hypothetical protein